MHQALAAIRQGNSLLEPLLWPATFLLSDTGWFPLVKRTSAAHGEVAPRSSSVARRAASALLWMPSKPKMARITVTPDSTDAVPSGRGGRDAFVRDAFGEPQESLALLAPAAEGTDPRLNQGERRISGIIPSGSDPSHRCTVAAWPEKTYPRQWRVINSPTRS